MVSFTDSFVSPPLSDAAVTDGTLASPFELPAGFSVTAAFPLACSPA